MNTMNAVVLITLILIFAISYLGQRHSQHELQPLSNQKLNKWLVGLSAGATANSGFVVTGGVSLGYLYGVDYLLLPLAWLLGDLLFWSFAPSRLNEISRQKNFSTIADLVTDKNGAYALTIKYLVSFSIIISLGLYCSAQWLAAAKIFSPIFPGIPSTQLGVGISLVIIVYSSVGGFRGSVYTDSAMAIIRIFGTSVALGYIIYSAMNEPNFINNINSAGASFLNPFDQHTVVSLLLFILGYAAAAFGFGLGQPQIISRYIAAASPSEVMKSRLIYIGFVQYTWISMTVFGLLLRGVIPDIKDPEAGLSLYFVQNVGGVIAGVILADIFATIAATANSVLITISQVFVRDVLNILFLKTRSGVFIVTLMLGVVTSVVASFLKNQATVFELALVSIGLLSSALGPPVLGRLFGWGLTNRRMLVVILFGLTSAILWRYLGFNSALNEAFPGLLIGISVYKFLQIKKGI